jgi:hypothetical protein
MCNQEFTAMRKCKEVNRTTLLGCLCSRQWCDNLGAQHTEYIPQFGTGGIPLIRRACVATIWSTALALWMMPSHRFPIALATRMAGIPGQSAGDETH